MDIFVTHQMGGMIESLKTGAYPDYIIFSSTSLKRTWRIKRKNKIQKGVLKVKGEIFFNYIFTDQEC